MNRDKTRRGCSDVNVVMYIYIVLTQNLSLGYVFYNWLAKNKPFYW